MKNILLVDKNVGNFKNMGEGKLDKLEGDPEKADSYSRGNTVQNKIFPRTHLQLFLIVRISHLQFDCLTDRGVDRSSQF